MTQKPRPRVFWMIRTRRRRLTTLAVLVVVSILNATLSWLGGDTLNGVFGTAGIVLFGFLLVWSLRDPSR